MDLQFPHHENEIAQSEAATGAASSITGCTTASCSVNEEKMSKSLGNFFTVREVLKRYRPEEVRYFILASHYRSPLNYSDDNLEKARQRLQRLYTALRDMDLGDSGGEASYAERFDAAMDDDFNTPEAIAVLFDLARAVNRAREQQSAEAQTLASTLRALGGRLGLLQADPEHYLQGATGAAGGLSDVEIQALVDARLTARAHKNWSEADRIRGRLAEQGVLLEDGAGATRWRRT